MFEGALDGLSFKRDTLKKVSLCVITFSNPFLNWYIKSELRKIKEEKEMGDKVVHNLQIK